MMLPRISAVLLFSCVSVDWTPSVGWSADLWVLEIVSCGSADLCVAGSCFIFLCVPDFDGGADTVLGINDI